MTGLLLALALANQLESLTGQTSSSVSPIIKEIGELEGARDPKCYATANRLENFIYGTPLADGARFEKIRLEKELARSVWEAAAKRAGGAGREVVGAGDVTAAATRQILSQETADGDWIVRFANGKRVVITARDKRQYGSIAYGLRAILTVQQEAQLSPGERLLPLDDDAVEALKTVLDVAGLAAMQGADQKARLADAREVSGPQMVAAWQGLMPPATAAPVPTTLPTAPSAPPVSASRPEFATVRAIVAQKVASDEAYNQIAMPVFLRNLQVYFARHRWPADAAAGEALRNDFAATTIAFAADCLVESERIARARGHALVRIEDVSIALQRFLPHRINEFEDAIYFPRLPPGERVTIEAYDLDAFRDSGIHWVYLREALTDKSYAGTLEPDPFAAELLVEGIAQFGVLALRVAGEVATEDGADRLSAVHLRAALQEIQKRIDRHATAPAEPGRPDRVVSSEHAAPPPGAKTFFSDQTASSGIAFTHRSADWLSRLMRSYTVKNGELAVLAVPPAFGGAGVAAEDVDGDGYPDVLLLSGSGNALLLNNRSGTFRDVTAEAGLAWVRPEDGRPGEPRQALIADFDNDDLQDILITYVEDAHRLYRNRGEHRFEDVTAAAGLGGSGSVAGPATALDYDRDGILDLYIGYFGDYPHAVLPTLARRNTNGLPNKLFRGLGGMRFADATPGSGTDNTGWTQALAHSDFDLDGWQDIIVGNDFGVNAYLRNLGDGTFVDVAASLGTDKPTYTMGIGATDLNRDGRPDFYISSIVTMVKDEKYVLPEATTPMKLDPRKLATMRVAEANDLFVSEAGAGGTPRYVASDAVGRGASSTGWSWGADFLDFDNDGDDDLYCVNGMNDYAVYATDNPYYAAPDGTPQPAIFPQAGKDSNVFFVNGGGMLHNESERSGADLLASSRSLAYLDFDRDGDLDILVNNYHAPAVFFRNDTGTPSGNWIAVTLQGDPARGSTRDAIGARLIVSSPRHRNLWREVRSTGSYLSSHPKAQHLGLGEDTGADVTVHWPGGEVSTIAGLEANRSYRIVQGDGKAHPIEPATPSP